MNVNVNRFPDGHGTAAVVIQAGTSESEDVKLGPGAVLIGIQTPAGWDAAGISFLHSLDGGQTWKPVYDYAAAAEVKIASPAVDQYWVLNRNIMKGVRHLKVRSGIAGAAVNQTAARTITLVFAHEG